MAAHEIVVAGPDGERGYSLEQWLEMDVRRRIAEIRGGHVRVIVGDRALSSGHPQAARMLGAQPRRWSRE